MWRIGPYRLDPSTFTLDRDGEPIALQRRPYDLLLYLVAHSDRVVSRDELLREVWGGISVASGAVSTAVYEVRAALGDLERPRDERLIETIRGRGFRFRGSGQVTEADRPNHDALPFIGRGRVLDRLRTRLEAARRGRGGALVVEGRAGIGKTRVLQELVGELSGFAIETVHCEPGAPPLWPWTQLRQSLGHADAVASPVELDEAEDDARLHFERIGRYAELLGEASLAHPVVVLIEDLHWADPSSRAVLESLAPRLSNERVQIIATERSEGDREPEGERVGSSRVERVRLSALRTTQLYPFIESILGRIPSPELVGWIERHSQGIPLMVRELAERVSIEGESLIDVPRIAGLVFAHRFDRLDATSRLAIGVASLCGIRFDAPLVEAAAGDALPADRVWIREGLQSGILVHVTGHPLRFAFRHALLRDAAESMLEATSVSGWHRRLASAIERGRPEPVGSTLSQLARHSAAAAVEQADVSGPLHYALLAAQRAARVFEWAEVATHTAHALSWIEYAPPGLDRDRQEIEAALLRCAAIASSTGHVEETAALLERIDPLLPRCGAPWARGAAEAFQFSNARCVGDYDRAWQAIEVIELQPELARVADCWRRTLTVATGDFSPSADDADWGARLPLDPEFHAFARLSGRDPGIDRLGHVALAHFARGEDARAVACAERAVAWADASGDARGRIWALFLLCTVHEMRRDWGELRRLAPEIDQAGRRTGLSAWLGVGAGFRLWAEAREKGDPSPALMPLARILHDRGRSTSTTLTTPLLLFASRVFSWSGAHETAARVAREGIAWVERTGEHMVSAELYRQLGHALDRGAAPEEAAAARRRGIELARRQGHVVSEARGLRDRQRAGVATPTELTRLLELEETPPAET